MLADHARVKEDYERIRQLGGKSIETLETLTNDKATLEVQLATQVRAGRWGRGRRRHAWVFGAWGSPHPYGAIFLLVDNGLILMDSRDKTVGTCLTLALMYFRTSFFLPHSKS